MLSDEIANLVNAHAEDVIPKTYAETLMADECDKWKMAIEAELRVHRVNGTWQVAALPTDQRPLTTRWVFAIKWDADGKLEKYKARLVVRGFEQKYGLDYESTFAPEARLDSMRVPLATSSGPSTTSSRKCDNANLTNFCRHFKPFLSRYRNKKLGRNTLFLSWLVSVY